MTRLYCKSVTPVTGNQRTVLPKIIKQNTAKTRASINLAGKKRDRQVENSRNEETYAGMEGDQCSPMMH